MDNGSGTPPVNEVVLSFAYERKPSSPIGPQLRDLLGSSYPSDATVEVTSPYLLIPELFPLQPMISPEMLIRTQEFDEPRYWVSSQSDPQFLVQVQDGYLALNWRRQTDPASPYVRYDVVRNQFIERVGPIHERLGSPPITRAEMSYINVIDELATGKVPSEIFPSFAPPAERIDVFSWAYAREFGGMGSLTHGRVHASASSGWQTKDLRPIVNFVLTARSAEIVSPSFEDVLRFFDAAHEVLNNEFTELVSPASLKSWGVS